MVQIVNGPSVRPLSTLSGTICRFRCKRFINFNLRVFNSFIFGNVALFETEVGVSGDVVSRVASFLSCRVASNMSVSIPVSFSID